MEPNAQRLSDLIEELIALSRTKISGDKVIILKKILLEVAEIENAELKRIFGTRYRNIDFDFYSKNEASRGIFNSNIVSSKKGKVEKKIWPPKIRINLFQSFNDRRLLSENREERAMECLELVDTVIHEFRHYYQSLRAQRLPYTIDDVNFAKQELLEVIDYDNTYSTNYWVYNNEIDARIFANDRLKSAISNIRDYWTRSYALRLHERLNNVSEEDYLNKCLAVYREGVKGYQQDKENYTNDKISRFIRANPYVLNIYQSLATEYKKDGRKKSCIDLISDYHEIILHFTYKSNISERRRQELKRNFQKIYYELIGNELINLSKRDERKLVSTIGKRNLDYLFSSMEEYYKAELNSQLQMLDRLKTLRLRGVVWDSYEAAQIRANFQIRNEMTRAKYRRRLQKISEYKYDYDMPSHELINGVDLEYIEPVILDDRERKARSYTLREMIRTYENIEDAFLFSEREVGERKAFSEVLNAVKYQRCSVDFMNKFLTATDRNISVSQVFELLRLLKAADVLTIEGGYDYVERLADVPFINDLLELVKNSDDYRRIRETSSIVGRRIIPYKTKAEKDKRAASYYLNYGKLRYGTIRDEFDHLRYRGNPEMVYHDDPTYAMGRLAVWKVTARQQGYDVIDIPGEIFGARIKGQRNGIITYEEFIQCAQDERVKRIMINGKIYDAIKNISQNREDDFFEVK